MFKFGFSAPESNDPKDSEPPAPNNSLQWFDAEEIPLFKTPRLPGGNGITNANMFCCGDFEIGYINVVPETLDDSFIKEAERKHSDLLPAKYEGGLKVWECTMDLAEYISDHWKDSLAGKRVLDLGCGGGILGIIALECGAIVDFQDYNKEVLTSFTIPNVCLNAEDKPNSVSRFDRAKFYSGDWKKFSELIGPGTKYDLILTSETIYNPDNYKKLLNFFGDHLATDGKVLLAAKGYYFGVGGSVTAFKQLIDDSYKHLSWDSVWTLDSGVKREILQLQLR